MAYRLEPRAVVRLVGEGALKFLHDVSTQDVSSLAPGDRTLLAFLTDKGRITAFARALVLDDSVLLDADAAAVGGLEAAMRHAVLAGVEVEVEALWPCIRFVGDLGDLLGITPAPRSVTTFGDVLCVRPSWGENGWDLLCHHLNGIEDRILGAGIAFGDGTDVEEFRIASGRPRFGVDVDAETLINETPLLVHAVSFAKGCYPGQESVARVHNLGRVNRTLRVLQTSARVQPGIEVRSGDEVVGAVTSAAHNHALAWIARGTDPGARVRVGDAEAVVTDAGWQADS